jgi:hypothetical protein
MVAEADNLPPYGFMSRFDRPLFLSEWDHAWPDEWLPKARCSTRPWPPCRVGRCEYSHLPLLRLGAGGSTGGGASTINGITYRNHFDSFNDPAKFGLFYQAALLFRRADVRRAVKTLTFSVRTSSTPGRSDWRLISSGMASFPYTVPAQATAVASEMHRVGIVLPDEDGPSADRTIPILEKFIDASVGEVKSDTGELYRSWSKRYGWIDSPPPRSLTASWAGPVRSPWMASPWWWRRISP